MADDPLRYDRMVERALRGVVRDALTLVSQQGLPADHHFYITFATRHAGVQIPRYLYEQYADEMTIVLQYQFYGLDVEADRFGVTLSFGGKHERLVVPFAAITTFADPAVNFALQFQTAGDDEDDLLAEKELSPMTTPEDEGTGEGQPTDDDGNVVTLDSFRKK